MVDLADWPCFIIGAAMGLVINRAVGLAINGAVSSETNIVIGFAELFLW